MNRRNIFFVLAVLFSTVLMAMGCGEQKAESIWRDREIVIDGVDSEGEWEGARYYLDEEKVAFGIMNDGDFLYLRLSSLDRTVRSKVLAGGLTIWFDGSGKCKKKLGILYPAGVSEARRPGNMGGMPRPGGSYGNAGDSGGPPSGPDDGERKDSASDERERAEALLRLIGTKLTIINGDDERTSVSLDEAAENGITCAVGMDGGSLIYEIALPLVRDEYRPYGIWPEATKKVGLVFETGKLTMPQSSGERGGMGGPGGSMGRRGGGMGGRGGGMGGSGGMSGGPAGMPDMSESLQLKVKITLAAQPSVP